VIQLDSDFDGDVIPGSLRPLAVHALRVLEGARDRTLLVATIAKHLRTSKTDAHNLMWSMRELGLVERAAGWLRKASPRYRLAVQLAVRP
jgi:DNA-binding IclR family transcriptional regulator